MEDITSDEESDGGDVDVVSLEEKRCRWRGCHEVLQTQDELVEHVHQIHVLKGQREYFCGWSGCERTNSFRAGYMLVVHVRRHTGEKPNKCTVS